MNETRHGFLGVQLNRPLREALRKVQRDIERAGGRAVPTKHLQLTLDDLGEVPEAAFEAAHLATERVVSRHQPFGVTLRGVEAWPPEAPRVVRALVDDSDGRLAALRAELHEALEGFGFAVPEGRWRPHVLLAKVDGEARPRLDPEQAFGTLKVRRVSLYRRERMGFEALTTFELPREATAETALPDSATDIAEELDRRVAERLEDIQRPQRPRRRSGARDLAASLTEEETK